MDFDKLFSGINNMNISNSINIGGSVNSSIISTGGGTVIINGKVVNNGGSLIQGSGNITTKEFDITNNSIDTLVYDLPGTIEIKVNPELKGKEYLSIEGEDNILNAIKVNASNSLDFELSGSVNLTKPLTVTFHTSELKRISCAGVGKIVGLYEGKKLRITSSGTGQVHLAGQVENLNISVSGTGSINCKDLTSELVDLSVSGTANAEVYASSSADISVSGIGKVKVYGSPAELTKHVSGLGSVEKVSGLQKKF